jgi:hypothetical protein
MRRVSILVVALGVLTLTAIADAAGPSRETETAVESFVDDELCGFPLSFNLGTTDVTTTFANGDMRRSARVDGTISANGVTLAARDRYSVLIDADRPDVRTITGAFTTVRFPAGGGMVVLEAGRIVYDRAAGEVLFEAGPHDFNFHSDVAAFCAAFGTP